MDSAGRLVGSFLAILLSHIFILSALETAADVPSLTYRRWRWRHALM